MAEDLRRFPIGPMNLIIASPPALFELVPPPEAEPVPPLALGGSCRIRLTLCDGARADDDRTYDGASQ